MHPVKTFRIFLSSPGDVATERVEVRKLLLGLERTPLLYGRVHMDVVSWDDEFGGATMDARLTPQQAVDRSLPKPAECDLTVVLLWGRMGTPLTDKRADGSQYLSGTEWEFEDAVRGSEAWTASIEQAARTSRELVSDVTARLDEVAKATESYASAMEEVAASSEEQSASTEQIAAAASSLATAAAHMAGLVGAFRLETGEIPIPPAPTPSDAPNAIRPAPTFQPA